MKTIESLTRREVIVPGIEGLDGFVDGWTEAVREAEERGQTITALVKEAVFRVMAPAYYGNGGQFNINYLIDRNKCYEEVFQEEQKKLKEAKKLPLFRRLFVIPKQRKKVERYHKMVEESAQYLAAKEAEYEAIRKPYESAARRLAGKCGIDIDEVYKTLEDKRAHVPFI